ncbi:MAG: YraN family protein [Moraxellaceae bacterium]|nr:YraN family protein [Moraxellaceae bacterium]MDZ4386810.1 YraN family protein [Moraxellaceae bacterium]
MTTNHKLSLKAGSPTQQKGRHAEVLAWRHLQQHGHNLVAHNYHCRLGEVDLITVANQILIFTEVRWRASEHYGGATGSITPAKIQRIRFAARFFLSCNPQWRHCAMRFDVIAFTGSDAKVRWIQGAF